MDQLLQDRADATALASLRSRPRHSPMDLVCSRVRRPSHLHRSHAGPAPPPRCDPGDDEYEYRVTVPNPRFPLPAPPMVRHHATQSLHSTAAWGPLGDASGLSVDLALTVMAAYLPFRMSDHEGAVRARDGSLISRQADRHYRAFHETFLLTMPADGGVVTEASVRSWIEVQERADKRRAA